MKLAAQVQYSTVQYSNVKFNAEQYSSIQYSTIQSSTMQYRYSRPEQKFTPDVHSLAFVLFCDKTFAAHSGLYNKSWSVPFYG